MTINLPKAVRNTLAAALAYVCTTGSALADDPLGLPTSADNSVWYRCYAAGERYFAKGDEWTARKYWSAALRTLERDPHPVKPNDIFFSVKLSALEQRFTESYPRDAKDDADDDNAKRLKLEQLESLRRMANINRRLLQPTDKLVSASRERYLTCLKKYTESSQNKSTAAQSQKLVNDSRVKYFR